MYSISYRWYRHISQYFNSFNICSRENLEIQEKLWKEINEFCDNEEITVELIKKITYLDLCIKETLRLCPPGTRLEIKCENGIYFNEIFIACARLSKMT